MKKYKLFLLLGLFVLLTGCSYSFEVKTNKTINKDEEASSIFLVVPDVSGMVEDDALEILEMNGFKIGKIILTKEYNYEDGLVIKTNPSSGSKINKDDVVDIYVSSSTSFEVEDYVGRSYLEVKPFLEDLGIIVEVNESDSSIYEDEFIIVKQTPEVGTILEEGDVVTLYIGGVYEKN